MHMRNDGVFVVEPELVSPGRLRMARSRVHGAEMRVRHQVALLIDCSSSFGRGVLQGVARYNQQVGAWSACFKPGRLSDGAAAWLRQWRGDGVLLMCDDPTVVEPVQHTRLPIVGIGAGGGVPRVTVDPVQIGALAAEHLLEHGLRHFGLCGTDEWGESFRQQIEAAGLVCHVFPSLRRGDRSRADAQQERLARWIEWLPKPVGIMACSDERGLEVMDACDRAGALVPDEVAVIGVNNDEAVCELSIPALSSIDVNAETAGYEAAALLDRLMASEQDDNPTVTTVAPRGVVARQSTDKAASDDEEIGRAVRYIRDNACRGLQVVDVLAHMAMSRGSLQQRMKQVMGRTIHQEIQRVRLDRAKDLLVNSDLAVKQVAKQSGFASVQYMTRVFRAGTGETPASYRRRRTR
jgi:LacI family transcriptional regulator